jgi:hypothetical protein
MEIVMPSLKSTPLIAASLVLLFAAAVQAQPGPRGPGGPQGAASAPSPGYGAGRGPGMMHGRWGRSFTPGWSMMSQQERDEHRRQMQEARTPEQCRAVRDEHRKLMEKRAGERGLGTMRGPRRDACGDWGKG